VNRVQLVIGGVVAIVAAVAVSLSLSGPDESVETKAPSVLPLDLERARSMAARLVSVETLEQTTAPNGYLQLIALSDVSEITAAILNDLYGQPVEKISLVLNGSVPETGSLKSITLASWIAERTTDPKSPVPVRYRIKDIYAGPLSPFIANDKMGKAFFNISVAYQTAEKSLGVQALADLGNLTLDPQSGRKALVFKTDAGQAAGRIEFAYERRPSLLAGRLLAEGSIAVSDVMETRLPKGGTLGQVLTSPLGKLWAANDQQFETACGALRNTLSNEAGLDVLDAATALWALTHRHALFAKGFAYEMACADERIARGLEVLEKDLPSADQKSKGPSISVMNSKLSRVGSLARNTDPEGALEKLAVLFAETVTLIDPYGVLVGLDDGGTIEAQGLSVHPATDGALASEYLTSLPVGKIACFNKGGGMNGHHRATLLSMQGDPSLWVLDLAFNSEGLIEGVALKEADKASVCQAIASRTTPESQCYFSKNGPYKPSDCR